MAVYCRICGTQNTDPGVFANLQNYRCGRCGNAALYRTPTPQTPQQKKNEAVVATILGAGIGGAIGGPPGAIIGGIIGAIISGSKPPETKK